MPSALIDYLVSLAVEKKAWAYLLVSRHGRVVDFGGNLAHFGLGELRTGQSAAERLVCLEGILPLASERLVLGSIAIRPGLHADIHIFSKNEGDWVLLMDVTTECLELQRLQQKANEASLLRDKLARCEQELEAARAQVSTLHEGLHAERQPTK